MFDESTYYSLRNKRFRVVSEQRKTEERTGWSLVLAARKTNESQKLNWGGGGTGGEGNPNPNPFILTQYPFFAPLLAPF